MPISNAPGETITRGGTLYPYQVGRRVVNIFGQVIEDRLNKHLDDTRGGGFMDE